MLCNYCKKETDERASGCCAHCGNPLGAGEYAPPDGFAFDPNSGKYYKTENRFNPHTGAPIITALWFDANSGYYQAACSEEGALITPQQDIPTEPPVMCVPLPAPPLPTQSSFMHEIPIQPPPLPSTEMPIAPKVPPHKNKRSKVAVIIVSLVMVVGIGALGFGVWQFGLLDSILSKSESETSSMPVESQSDVVSKKPSAPSSAQEPSSSVPPISGDDGNDPDYDRTNLFTHEKDGVNLGVAGITIRYNGKKPEGYCTPDKVTELELFENGMSIGQVKLNGKVSRFYLDESDSTLFDFSFTEIIEGDNRHFEVVYKYNGVQRGDIPKKDTSGSLMEHYETPAEYNDSKGLPPTVLKFYDDLSIEFMLHQHSGVSKIEGVLQSATEDELTFKVKTLNGEQPKEEIVLRGIHKGDELYLRMESGQDILGGELIPFYLLQ